MHLRADALGFLNDRLAPQTKDPNCNLDLIHMTACPPFLTKMSDTMGAIRRFNNVIGSENSGLIFGNSNEDIRRILRADPSVSGRTTVVRGLQHVPDDVNVSMLFDAGIRVMQIAYQGLTRFGGGFAAKDAPLTEDGKRLLRYMAACEMILDLSHAGHRTALDALALIEAEQLPLRVMASHTGVYEVYDHLRNLTTEILQKIASQGGVIGLYTLTFGLHATSDDPYHFIKHLHHLRDTLPASSICLGTDGIHRYVCSEEQKKQFDVLKAKIDPDGHVRARYPDEAEFFNCSGKIDAILAYLEQTEPSLDGIEGDNLVNFFESALPST